MNDHATTAREMVSPIRHYLSLTEHNELVACLTTALHRATNEALERAAKVADDYRAALEPRALDEWDDGAMEAAGNIAAAIRAPKDTKL